MKIAIVGSRNLTDVSIAEYIDEEVSEIVSGGAKGIDTLAAEYAKAHNLTLTEFLPQYELYGRAAPIVRNKEIVDYADLVLIFWNGTSRGTLSVIKYAKKTGKAHRVILCTEGRVT
ncbi:MAG: DUF2493 domain-containing protein [Clostridia bacterium]|nr:DUF2493 domain-containing protein [Clostridia bacterium]